MGLVDTEVNLMSVDGNSGKSFLIPHQSTNSFSLFQPVADRSVWSKFSSFGHLLFEKDINFFESYAFNGLQIAEKDSMTLFYSRNSQEILTLDNRIGVQLEKVSISRFLKNSIGDDLFLLSTPTSSSLNFLSARDISTSDKLVKQAKSLINFVSVQITRSETSLLHMTHSVRSPSFLTSSKNGKIVSGHFSEEVRKEIHQNIINFYQKIYFEEYQAFRNREIEDSFSARQLKKRKISKTSVKAKQFYVTIDMAVVEVLRNR